MLLVLTILTFQPPGCLDDVLDCGAAQLILFEQRSRDTLNIAPIAVK